MISCHWNIKARERDITDPETQGSGFCFTEILKDCSMKLHQDCLPCKKGFPAIFCEGVNKSKSVLQWAVKCCCCILPFLLPETNPQGCPNWMDHGPCFSEEYQRLSPWNKSFSLTSLKFNLSFWGEGARRREWGELQIAVATFRFSYCKALNHWASLSLLEP